MIDRFLDMSHRELEAALDGGHPVSSAVLAGQRYRGVSLGLPAWVDRLAWKTFEKDFLADEAKVRGWNVRLEQTGLEGPVCAQVTKGIPRTFGHFVVHDLEDGTVELDYGVARNPRLDPSRRLRDPLVALEAGEQRWLLGCSDVDVAGWRLRTPSYFLLEHLGPVTFVPV